MCAKENIDISRGIRTVIGCPNSLKCSSPRHYWNFKEPHCFCTATLAKQTSITVVIDVNTSDVYEHLTFSWDEKSKIYGLGEQPRKSDTRSASNKFRVEFKSPFYGWGCFKFVLRGKFNKVQSWISENRQRLASVYSPYFNRDVHAVSYQNVLHLLMQITNLWDMKFW